MPDGWTNKILHPQLSVRKPTGEGVNNMNAGDYIRSFNDPKLARYLAETTGLAILAAHESYGKILSQKDKNDILDKLTEEYLKGLQTPLEENKCDS